MDHDGTLLPRGIPVSRLKPFHATDEDATPVYQVSAIVNHRRLSNGSVEYLTAWKHTDMQTWEPSGHFMDKQCITDYWKTRQLAQSLEGGDVVNPPNIAAPTTTERQDASPAPLAPQDPAQALLEDLNQLMDNPRPAHGLPIPSA
jgi:hypothetical protein